MAGKSFGRHVNRRLSTWTKGVIANAFDSVSSCRGFTVVLVYPAYPSQIDFRTDCLDGKGFSVTVPTELCCKRIITLREPCWQGCLILISITLCRIERYKQSCWNGLSVAGWDCLSRTPVARQSWRYQRRANDHMRPFEYKIWSRR
jgi:hypothetical protein